MPFIQIFRGDDKTITVSVVKNGTPVDLDALQGLIAIIYSQTDNIVLAQYSVNVKTGFDSDNIEVTDGPGGIFKIYLQASVTDDAFIDKYLLEIKTQQADANFEDSRFMTVSRGVELFELDDSDSKLVASLT